MFQAHHWTCPSVRTFVFLVGPVLGAGDVLAGLFVFLVGPVVLGAGDVLAGLFVCLVGPVVLGAGDVLVGLWSITDRPWFSTVTHGQAEIGAVVNVVVRNGAACLQLSAGKEQPSHLLG